MAKKEKVNATANKANEAAAEETTKRSALEEAAVKALDFYMEQAEKAMPMAKNAVNDYHSAMSSAIDTYFSVTKKAAGLVGLENVKNPIAAPARTTMEKVIGIQKDLSHSVIDNSMKAARKLAGKEEVEGEEEVTGK